MGETAEWPIGSTTSPTPGREACPAQAGIAPTEFRNSQLKRTMSITYLSLGSNLGDREKNINAAIEQLRSLGTLKAVSSHYETAPQGGLSRSWYINCVARLDTTLSPQELLDNIHAIEQNLGRVRAERFGPRTIDIDILMYDDEILNEPDLTIPHPRLHERAFVMIPLLEIAPSLTHPILKRNLFELLTLLPPQSVQKIN